ncbi:hypothetical protein V1478_011554 [Vespula squamosa]|uniref:Uncharacterized protein n=1 Tax=Vespula squamosa TaxID=30214 RepID=A0ABD2AHH0_VESSQ
MPRWTPNPPLRSYLYQHQGRLSVWTLIDSLIVYYSCILDIGWPDLLSKVHHQQYPSFFAHSSATLLTAVPARVRQHTSNTSNTSTNTSSNTNANKRVA